MDPDDISQCISLVYGIKCPQCCYFFSFFPFSGGFVNVLFGIDIAALQAF